MGLLRCVKKLNRAISLFRDIEMSCYLIFFKEVISLDNKRGCSRASER